MAQIDREEGNQSALGEAFNSHNHSHTFEKKRSSIYSHSQTIMPMFREKEDRFREDRQRGIIKNSWNMELAGTFQKALTHCSDNNIFSAQA